MNVKIVLAVAAGLSVVAIPACMQAQSANEALADIDKIAAMDELSHHWSYNEQKDEMRGTVTRIASVRAEGWATMSPELFVWRGKNGVAQIGLRGSLDEATAPNPACFDSLKIKFDDGPIRQVACNMGMAVSIDPAIFDDLQKSKTMWIESATNMGTEQFKFATADLKI